VEAALARGGARLRVVPVVPVLEVFSERIKSLVSTLYVCRYHNTPCSCYAYDLVFFFCGHLVNMRVDHVILLISHAMSAISHVYIYVGSDVCGQDSPGKLALAAKLMSFPEH
jgi:hypothetical protein